MALGYRALYANTEGYHNVAMGYDALGSNTTGDTNVAVGSNVLKDAITASNNTGIGYYALGNTTGANNVGIGALSLFSNITGASNIALGYYAGAYETGSNAFYVNNQNRTNTAGDKALSLIYGTFAATAAGQAITFNVGIMTAGNYEFDADQTVGAGQDNYVLTYDNGTGQISLEAAAGGTVTASIGASFDGGGSAISADKQFRVEVPYACTITQVTMLADQSGSAVVDIWKDTYANYPPTDVDSITASAVPTISASNKSQDSTLSGWTTSVSAGDILVFNVDSCSTIEELSIILKVTKT